MQYSPRFAPMQWTVAQIWMAKVLWCGYARRFWNRNTLKFKIICFELESMILRALCTWTEPVIDSVMMMMLFFEHARLVECGFDVNVFCLATTKIDKVQNPLHLHSGWKKASSQSRMLNMIRRHFFIGYCKTTDDWHCFGRVLPFAFFELTIFFLKFQLNYLIFHFQVVLVFVLSIASLIIYFVDASNKYVEVCTIFSDNITQQIDLVFNIFFMVYFFIRVSWYWLAIFLWLRQWPVAIIATIFKWNWF